MFLNSRRNFLKNSFLSTTVIVMSNNQLFGAVSPLQTISIVQNDLFPLATTLDVNVSNYISFILVHTRVTSEDKLFIRNGVQWLNEEAINKYKTTYIKLNSTQRQNILKIISQQRWGENWIDTILTYAMEAMFSDGVYGVNSNNAGKKWIGYSSGRPYPKESLS